MLCVVKQTQVMSITVRNMAKKLPFAGLKGKVKRGLYDGVTVSDIYWSQMSTTCFQLNEWV